MCMRYDALLSHELLSHDMAHRRPRQEAQLFVEREAAEIGFHRAGREGRALGVVDLDGDNDGPATACDLVGLFDHAGDVAVVVHWKVRGAGRESHALDVELPELRAGLAAIGNRL